MPSLVRPLLVRDGARFRCHGDGVCCTDAHVLGPIDSREARRLGLLETRAVVRDGALDALALRTTEGRCVRLGDEGCALHADGGAAAKPAGCRRFPFGLVATPDGGRVTTSHRCPCRTLGSRPALVATAVEPSLLDRAGRLRADGRAPSRIALEHGRSVPFRLYRRAEMELLAALARAERPERALRSAPLPRMQELAWIDVAHLLRSRLDGTACGVALAWAGDVLLAMVGGGRRPARTRPWAWCFDRAQARSPEPVEPRALLADWLADELWSLAWTDRGSLAVARAELATRAAIALEVASLVRESGARADRAMAEAILVVELAGESPLWRGVVARIDELALCDARG